MKFEHKAITLMINMRRNLTDRKSKKAKKLQ